MAIRSRERDVQTTIDARLQVRVAAALRDGIQSGRFGRGAAVVLDADTGELLAAASYPWPSDQMIESGGEAAGRCQAIGGVAGPGTLRSVSSGIHVQAAHGRRRAPRDPEDGETFVCMRLPDGRVGNYVRGRVAAGARRSDGHGRRTGTSNLQRGLVVSCNAYFAQLALASARRRCSTRRRSSKSTSRVTDGRRRRADARSAPATDKARRS